MEGFCGSQLWDTQLTWNTTDPYFTPCFESLVINLVPVAFLLLFGFTEILSLRESKFKAKSLLRSFTPITALKTTLSTVISTLQITEILRLMLADPSVSDELVPIDYVSPAIQLVAHVGALCLLVLTQYHLIASSGVQFIYWLLAATTQAIRFRTAVEHFKDLDTSKFEIIYLTTLISFPLIAVRFFFEFVHNDTCSSRRKGGSIGIPSPEVESTFIAKLLLLWYDSLAWTGYRRTITQGDLWDLNAADTSQVQMHKFNEYWNKEIERVEKLPPLKSGGKASPGVWKPLMKCYGLTFMFALAAKFASDMLVFVQPTMLRFLVDHFTNHDQEPAWKGFFYAGVICVAFAAQIAFNSTCNRIVITVGMQIRAALSSAVFRKALVISSSSKRESSMGEMVNLQSVDSNQVLMFLPNLAFGFGGPFQIIISIVLLYNTLGPSIFAGVAILVSLVPLNMFVVSITRKFQMQQMKLKDERLKLTSEILSGIKVLKLYAWEPAYHAQIESIRQKEMACLKKIAYLNMVTGFIFQITPGFVSLASFVTFVYSSPNNVPTADKIFVSINLFNIMRFPMIFLPLVFSNTIQMSVSINRLRKYLNMEELDKSSITHKETHADPIVIENATLSWTKASEKKTTLRNINFNVKKGELVAVVGTIGSGKTSLLASLLGDLEKQSGVINTLGDIAYVSQSAWIQNATLKDNILFGDKFVAAKYKRTIAACALEKDLKILDAGDQTEIGEKGINLSGGQKQRVALARAAYKDAAVYLFDDPLSAVDAHVGKHIFEHLISGNGMLSNKTRVLVTHAISLLPRVDRIVVMKNGEISESGTYRELILKQGEFAEFLLTHVGVDDDEDGDPDTLSVVQDLEEVVGADVIRRRSTANKESLAKILLQKQPKEEPRKATPKKLITEEIAAEGNIKFSIFLGYFKSAGVTMTIMALIFSAVSNGLVAASNIWLSNWSTQATLDHQETGTTRPETSDKYILGYGLFALAISVALFFALLTLSWVGLAASRILNATALASVLRSPMSYFDTTPLGRILNRFSKDVDTIDNLIPLNMRTFLAMFFNVLYAILVISYTTPEFIGFVIPIVIVYIFLQRFYTSTSRQLKRLDGVSRSPIYSHFGETISGSSIIRAFRMEDDFISESEKRIDDNQKSLYPFLYSNTWVTVRLEFLGLLTILATCLFTLLSRGTLDPGSAGLAITYSLQITNFLNFLARQISDLEANIVSAERMGELRETPQEPAWESADSKLSPEWPQHGQLIFDNYMTRYREGLDLVLKGISCKIEPGEKIGVVGRTGAGKSSLTLALFRIIEASSGSILIDGIDISKLGLHDLRKKITIIPQDPVLFSGTLRLNLDPFNQYSDEQVWRCLELAHLKPYVSKLQDGLFQKVEEEGQNFSVGQRQLICLARALLRKTKILVLDEATAAVDLETDDLIQATIRKEFIESTVITIAHRLNTIVDSNRVMVLDKGEIKEFASPQALLGDASSIFWSMAKDAKLV